MKYNRIVISKFGGRENLNVIEDETGELAAGNVRVRVFTSGVAWADVMMRTGLYPGKMPLPPFTPGYNIVGVVEQSNASESGFKPGDPVAAITKFGGYSEIVDVKASLLVPVPSGVDFAQAACLSLNYLTAYQIIHRFAQVKRGETVLIHGAGGGVGTAFLQLGAIRRLRMLGTESTAKQDAVRQLGGIPIDYHQDDFVKKTLEIAPGGVDAAFDPIGGTHLVRTYETLNSGGRLIAYGERAIVGEGVHNPVEEKIHNDFMAAHREPVDGKTVRWYESFDVVQKQPEWYHEDMSALMGCLKFKKISPLVAGRLPYQEAAHAHELLETTGVVGKLVLLFNQE